MVEERVFCDWFQTRIFAAVILYLPCSFSVHV